MSDLKQAAQAVIKYYFQNSNDGIDWEVLDELMRTLKQALKEKDKK